MKFTQTISFAAADADALKVLLDDWHAAEAGSAPGYLGSRLLADREHPGRYLMVVDFASAAEAQANNDRPETRAWAQKFMALIQGDPGWGNYDEVHRTS